MLTKFGGLAAILALAFMTAGSASYAADAPAAPPAPAVQAPPAPTLIVLDFERILQDSKAGKSLAQQLQQRAAAFQKNFQQLEGELNTDQQTLARQQSILAQDAFSAKVRDLQRRADEVHEKEAQANAALNQGRNDGILQIQQKIKPILDDIMKERGANVVLTRTAVMVIADDRFDVTEEALKRLDEKLPVLNVNVAEPAAPSAAAPKAAAPAPAPAPAPAKKK
jgi:outer membrane protein